MADLFSKSVKLDLKNRAVMAPMTRYMCSDDGLPSDDMIAYYLERAQNNLGLIIVESAAVNSMEALAYRNGLQFNKKEHCTAWQPIVKKIKENGTKVILQLYHAGRLTVPEISQGKVLAPSPKKTGDSVSFWRPKIAKEVVHFQTNTKFQTPSELTKIEIKKIVKEFELSCQLAQEAGFDGVELHGAHGYLLHQFVSAHSNCRVDEYKSPDFKFVRDLVRDCRKCVDENFILSYRLSIHMIDNTFMRYDPQDIEFGNLIKILDLGGVDLFHSSELSVEHPVFGSDVSLHSIIKKNTDKPIIACGRVNSLETANWLIENEGVELVAFGRNLISNPNLLELFHFNKEKHIIPFKYELHMRKA